ncbi:MAG: hypothetical protein V1690_00885 [Candidatus Moraniibacteriota bacterium]
MKIKKTSIVLFAFATVITGYYIAKAATWGFTGFSWIGNNLVNGVEQGDPVIGMITMQGGDKYQVKIEGDSDQRLLTGSAWIGIGSQDDKFNDFSNQNDLPSLGWIHFNQSFDQTKLYALLSANCFGAGDCWGVRWNKKANAAQPFEGYISGWARMEIGPNADGTSYPDVWVHFKSPGNPVNYTCNDNDHNYYVCIDGNGKLEGYAWSAGADASSIDANPGLGWIRFSKQFVYLSDMGVVPSKSQFCATLLDSGSSGVGCKNSDAFTGDFKLKAYQAGFTLNNFDPGKNYQWTCNDKDAPKAGEQVTCNYPESGSYTPKLKVYDEATQKWVDCANQTTVKVTTQSSCSVLARKASTGDKEEFGKNTTIAQGDTIEAKISRQCLDGGEIKWTVSGGTKLSENGDTIGVGSSGVGNIRISAQLVKDGKTSNCGSADVKVTETVKWR